MRAVVPKRIQELADIQLPYVFYNKETGLIELKPNAPAEVIEAREEYLAWWKTIREENS